jgi:hypothetical protein
MRRFDPPVITRKGVAEVAALVIVAPNNTVLVLPFSLAIAW